MRGRLRSHGLVFQGGGGGGGGGGGVQFKAIVHVGVYVVCSFSIQVAVVYMCTRLIVNLTQVYTPLYLVDSLKLPKVCL